MIVLDTDILSVLDSRRGDEFVSIQRRLQQPKHIAVCSTIISFEEQMRGWLSYIAASKNSLRQVEGYARLHSLLLAYRGRPLLDFDAESAQRFDKLIRVVRIGTMDLKIAAICLSNNALLVSRNLRDFRKVPGLQVEDWTHVT